MSTWENIPILGFWWHSKKSRVVPLLDNEKGKAWYVFFFVQCAKKKLWNPHIINPFQTIKQHNIFTVWCVAASVHVVNCHIQCDSVETYKQIDGHKIRVVSKYSTVRLPISLVFPLRLIYTKICVRAVKNIFIVTGIIWMNHKLITKSKHKYRDPAIYRIATVKLTCEEINLYLLYNSMHVICS